MKLFLLSQAERKNYSPLVLILVCLGQGFSSATYSSYLQEKIRYEKQITHNENNSQHKLFSSLIKNGKTDILWVKLLSTCTSFLPECRVVGV